MKKLLLLALLVLGTNFAKAQESKTSITAGYTNVNLKAKVRISEYDEISTESTDGGGFFIGITREINISDKFSFKPGILYTNTLLDESDDDKFEHLQIPFYFNYYANEKIFLSAGPKIDYLLENDFNENYNKISLALGIGIGFELSPRFDLIANYSFQITNSLSKDFTDEMSNELGTDVNASLKQNFLNIGLAYNF